MRSERKVIIKDKNKMNRRKEDQGKGRKCSKEYENEKEDKMVQKSYMEGEWDEEENFGIGES